MADVEEIIDFIKSLKKGFDKDLFQNKLDELAYAVDTTGLEYDDFHTLFKVWLNLSLPVTKWVNLGSCLAPPDIVEERTVQYALRWILANIHDQTNSSRVGFLLDWLTVAMESDSIDMTALDMGYDVFYTMLTFEVLAVHAMKLIYTLTKPVDVTRKKVLDLINYAKKREAQKSMHKPLLVLLGLFKSYKPECVPEDIPAIPIYSAFKKPNNNLLVRFRKTQERRSRLSKQRQYLMWSNPINCERGRNKKVEPLVPNVEFIKSGRHTQEGEMATNFLDFADPASVVASCVQRPLSRPARLRALLVNSTGHTLLALLPPSDRAFLAHDLTHLLRSCFLEVSPYSYAEKQDLLKKLVLFQRTLVRGLPVVSRFLAQYLLCWNESDHFQEVLELAECASAECPQLVLQIARRLSAAGLRAPPLAQAAVVRSLTRMYTSLVYDSARPRRRAQAAPAVHEGHARLLPALAAELSALTHKALQCDPDDYRVQYMCAWSAARAARAEQAAGAAVGAPPSPLALALPLLAASSALVHGLADLMILYRKILSSDKASNEDHIQMISQYLNDMLNCLYSEEAFTGSEGGLIFKQLHPQLVDKLTSLIPDANSKLSLRNHVAFAPYTYMKLLDVNHADADNKMLFHLVIESEFPRLGLLMKKTLPELRYR